MTSPTAISAIWTTFIGDLIPQKVHATRTSSARP